MDIIQWLLISANALNQTVTQIDLLTLATSQSSTKLIPILEQTQLSLNLTASQTKTNLIMLTYALVALITKRPQLLAAFFITVLLFEWSLFDNYSEAQLYLLEFIVYSYVITCNVFSNKTKLACGIMCLLCLVFAYDAAFYGVNGFYGALETVIYNSIEHLVICCHILIICTTVNLKRITNAIKSLCYSIGCISRYSVNFTIL
jgi:hypothetical protein